MPTRRQKWTVMEMKLIDAIKLHPSLHVYSRVQSNVVKLAWSEVSAKVNMSVCTCQRQWFNMKHIYAKLKNMIFMGRVTEDMVKNHKKTKKYMNGSLDFLNPFLSEIPDWKTPSYAQIFFESVFPKSFAVNVEKIIKVSTSNDCPNNQMNGIEVIEDYTQRKGIEPMSILPNNENYDDGSNISSDDETSINSVANQPIKKETDSEDMEPMEHTILSFLDSATNQSIKEEMETLVITENELESVEHDVAFTDFAMTEPIKNAISTEKITESDFKSSEYNITLQNFTLNEPIKIEGDIHEIFENNLGNLESLQHDVLPDIEKRYQEHNRISVNDNVETNFNSSNRSILKEMLVEKIRDDYGIPNTFEKSHGDKNVTAKIISNFLIKYNYSSNKNADLKHYFNDLSEVLCSILPPEKRKQFLSQIDLLVSEILEGAIPY